MIAVVRFPYISNFTDMNTFEQFSDVDVRYVTKPIELKKVDIVILPGSKNTLHDLRWLKETGMFEELKNIKGKIPLIGICGGFQVLGISVEKEEGLKFLPFETEFKQEKMTTQVEGTTDDFSGFFSCIGRLGYAGYEIHHGVTGDVRFAGDGDMVLGTYVHGLFDKKEIAESLVGGLRDKKGSEKKDQDIKDYKDFKEIQYDGLSRELRSSLDMDLVYSLLVDADVR